MFLERTKYTEYVLTEKDKKKVELLVNKYKEKQRSAADIFKVVTTSSDDFEAARGI